MNRPAIDAVILAGGLGTRLQSVSDGRPKPLVSIGSKPFLEILIDYLRSQGLERFIFSLGFQASQIENHFRSYSGAEFVFVREESPLGTAGGLKLTEPFLKSDPILVLNGDSLCLFDLHSFFDFHRQKKAEATLLAVNPDERRDAGSLQINKDGRILSFREKDKAVSPMISAGIYLFNRTLLAKIPAQKICSLEKDIFPSLENAYAFPTAEKLYDIGTPERLETFRKIYPSLK